MKQPPIPLGPSCATEAGPTLLAAVIHACGTVVPFPQSVSPKQGIGLGPEVKSLGLPKKSQRSPVLCGLLDFWVPLKLLPMSCGAQGNPVCRVTIELSCHPSSNCPCDFLPGRA